MELQSIMKEAVTISEEASFSEAVSLMIERQTNSLLVVDNNGVLVGEISVTDLLDAIVPEYLDGDNIAAHFAAGEMFNEAVVDTAEKQVKFFMDTTLKTVHENEGMMSIAATAIANQRARIPVVDANNKPLGVISRRGLKHIINDALNTQTQN